MKQRYRRYVRAAMEGVIYLLLAVTVIMAAVNFRRKRLLRQKGTDGVIGVATDGGNEL